MNKALRLKFNRLMAILICLVFAVSSIAMLSAISFKAYAAADDYTPFADTEMTIDNSQFVSSSGSAPQTPDSWTGGAVAGETYSNVTSGVMDLTKYSANKDAYKLEEDYPDEFKGNIIPKSPWSEDGGYPGTNDNVLMINSRPSGGSGNAFGYTSSALSLEANRFYSVKAWVRTGNFGESMGAAIRLNGLNDSVAFNNINTVAHLPKNLDGNIIYNKDNYYGWSEYTFLIATNPYSASSVTLSLQVGDRYVSEDKPETNTYDPATGYAFFDNIHAYEISPEEFYSKKSVGNVQNTHTLIKDYSDLKDYKTGIETEAEKANYNFKKPLSEGWRTQFAEESNLADVKYGIYNAYPDFHESNNDFNIKKEPASSLGKYEEDSSVLAISSFNKNTNDYNSVAVGLSSTTPIKIERFKYYRISAWVKTIDTSGGSGATLVLHSKRNSNKDKDLNAKISNMTGDSANVSRGGYKQYSFFVKGSALFDHEAYIQCWLGTSGNASKGIALFDNLMAEEITPTEFNENSANGTLVNMDTDTGTDGSSYITFPETGIANGEFYLAGAYTDYKFPLAVQDWNGFAPDAVNTTGYSVNKVNTDKVISGLMPTEMNHFLANSGNYGMATNPKPDDGSVLLITSTEKTAYNYTSPAFSVTAPTEETTNTIGKLTVSMYTENIEGYGANLVLKNGNRIIASIEKIQSTNDFVTYTFYIETGATDVGEMTVEIWLGLNDRSDNLSKLSSGSIYVERVAFENVTTENFASIKSTYDNAKRNNLKVTTAAYSFKNETFDAFDYYDNGFVKYPYNWTASGNGTDKNNVKFGIFDPKNGLSNQVVVPNTFENTKDATNNGVLFLYNTVPAYSKLSLNSAYTLAADTYYRLTVRLKVDIPSQSEKAVGANINISGTEYSFKNIKDTSETHDTRVDKEIFQTFTFYIKSSSSGSSLNLDITLGDSLTSQYCEGKVYVNEIVFTDINNSVYDSETTDEMLEKNSYIQKVDLSSSTEGDTETTPTEKEPIQWWLIPSILLAVAILIAVVGVCIRKIMERTSKKKTYKKTLTYDRTATLNKDHNEKAVDDSEKVAVAPGEDKTYDTFDESDIVVTPAKKATAPLQNEDIVDADIVTEDAPTSSDEKQVETTDVQTKEEVAPADTKLPTFTDDFED